MFEGNKPINPLVEVNKVKGAYETFIYMLKERLDHITNECVTSDDFESEIGEVINLIDEYNSGDLSFKDIVSGLNIESVDNNSILGLVSTLQSAVNRLEAMSDDDSDEFESLFDFRENNYRSIYMGDEPVSLLELAEDTHLID